MTTSPTHHFRSLLLTLSLLLLLTPTPVLSAPNHYYSLTSLTFTTSTSSFVPNPTIVPVAPITITYSFLLTYSAQDPINSVSIPSDEYEYSYSTTCAGTMSDDAVNGYTKCDNGTVGSKWGSQSTATNGVRESTLEVMHGGWWAGTSRLGESVEQWGVEVELVGVWVQDLVAVTNIGEGKRRRRWEERLVDREILGVGGRGEEDGEVVDKREIGVMSERLENGDIINENRARERKKK